MPKRRLEISDNGRIVYAQDVDSYKLEFDSTKLTLEATHELPRDPNAPVVTVDGGPPLDLDFTTVIAEIPPPPSAGAPDGHDDEPPVQVIERVHTGDRTTDTTPPAKPRRRTKPKAAG